MKINFKEPVLAKLKELHGDFSHSKIIVLYDAHDIGFDFYRIYTRDGGYCIQSIQVSGHPDNAYWTSAAFILGIYDDVFQAHLAGPSTTPDQPLT